MLVKDILEQNQVKESAYSVGTSGSLENILLRMIAPNKNTDISQAFHNKVNQYKTELVTMKHKITKDIEDSFRNNPPSDVSEEVVRKVLSNPERLAEALLDYLLTKNK